MRQSTLCCTSSLCVLWYSLHLLHLNALPVVISNTGILPVLLINPQIGMSVLRRRKKIETHRARWNNVDGRRGVCCGGDMVRVTYIGSTGVVRLAMCKSKMLLLHL